MAMLDSPPLSKSATPAAILLVDDERLVLRMMVRLLESAGHTVIACNGYEQVEVQLARGIRPDLLVTDVALGQSTGIRVAAIVQEALPQTPVMFISGYGNVIVGYPVLQKPFDRHQLLAAVDKALATRGSQMSVAETLGR